MSDDNTCCTICGKTYVQIQGLYRHQRQKHGMSTTRKLFQCHHCNLQFQSKCQLLIHLKNHNRASQSRKINKRIKCALLSCDEKFANYKSYRSHLEQLHSYTLKEDKLHFESEHKFHEWKTQIEEEQKITYVQDTAAKILGSFRRIYYICHRSYCPRQIQNPRRHPKNIGSNKIKRACPAMLIASIQIDTNAVEVNFFSTHVGHECEISRTRLSKIARSRIAGKLLEGFAIQQVLDDVREEAAKTGSIERRTHLLEKKDLHNIKRDFGISYSTKLHENDTSQDEVNEIKVKCEILMGLSTRTNLKNDSLHKINRLLDDAIKEATTGETNIVLYIYDGFDKTYTNMDCK